MPTLEISDQQLLSLIRQLPAERRLAILYALAEDSPEMREAQRQQAEKRLRELAAGRGRDWNAMNDDERQDFVDELVHEDSPCHG